MSVEAPAPGSAPALPQSASPPVPAEARLPAPAAPASSVEAPRCDNCGASVPGRYCGNCGQRLEPPLHSLGHFIGVAAEDLTHADSRLWRTLLALLIRPGKLTREFLSGRRASYLPPVRLYLVVSVVFFLWMAFHSSHGNNHIISFEGDDDTPAAAAPATPGAAAAAPSAAPAAAAPPSAAPSSATPPSAAPPSAAAAAGAGSHSRYVNVKNSADPKDCAELAQMWTGPRMARTAIRQACEKGVKDGGRSLSEGLVHNLPRAMFVFLPLLAAAMMLFYWRPRRYYVEHLLFLLHNHAFVFVYVMLWWALTVLLPPVAPVIGLAGTVYLVWYLYRAMRVVYAQGPGLTIAKMLAMSFIYLVFGGLMLLITLAYSVYATAT
jgi:hypothetical protein